MEDSNAKEALQAEPQAAGAYDRVPFANASAIFTMDTSNDIFLVHSLQVCTNNYNSIENGGESRLVCSMQTTCSRVADMQICRLRTSE